MNLFNTIPLGNCSRLSHLVRSDHPGRHPEPDNAEIGILFSDNAATGEQVLVDWWAS
jgi:hypothetical protein